MSLQLREIILYGSNSRVRRLPFRLDALNIITGRSGTGKSAIIPILDYCLGRSTFTVPEGVIRETIAWYAILLRHANGTDIFVAKPGPSATASSQSQGFLLIGTDVEPPAMSHLTLNTSDAAIEATLSKYLGISPNLHVPSRGRTRDALETTVAHTKFYLFQEQGIIANRDVLFFRQAEPFLPQAMKDTLPYLLGVVDEDRLATLEALRQARRRVKLLERDLEEAQTLAGGGITRGQALLDEARQVGLIPTEVRAQSPSEIRLALQALTNWQPRQVPMPSDETAAAVRARLAALRSELRTLAAQLAAAQTFSGQASVYQEEVAEQATRLESVNLVNSASEGPPTCPLCGHSSESLAPTAADLQARLLDLRFHLQGVEQERPRLAEHIAALQDRRESIRQEIREHQYSLVALEKEDARAAEINDQNVRVASVIGRIAFYLESTPENDEVSRLRAELDSARAAVLELESRVGDQESEDLLSSYLNRIGKSMTEYASKLPFEHASYPLRLDLNRLTVVADRPQRPFPMQRMGSGQNWLVCHLSAILALHKHFRSETRPVPALLVLDQPTQVYFPSREDYEKVDGTVQGTVRAGADLDAVRRVFQLLYDFMKDLKDLGVGIQLIVLEHANLEDSRFQQALVEPPWDGVSDALVPPRWLSPQPTRPTR